MTKRQLLDVRAGQLCCLAELQCLIIQELQTALPNLPQILEHRLDSQHLMNRIADSSGCDGEPVSAHFLHGFSRMKELISVLLDGYCKGPQRELFGEDESMVDVG